MMTKINLLVIIMALIVIGGCASSSALIRTSNISTRSDVFEELSNGGLVPPGYAELRVASSLKTHKPGIYSAKDIHGTSDYKLLLNIDGQAVQLQGSLQEENSGSNGLRDVEAGEGTRYRFNKKLRLKSGTHKVILAIPADDLAVERVITLAEGSSNSLVLEPVYRQTPGKRRPGFYGKTSYKEGIKGISLILNDKPL